MKRTFEEYSCKEENTKKEKNEEKIKNIIESSKIPNTTKFLKSQITITENVSEYYGIVLDAENTVGIFGNVLNPEQLSAYLKQAVHVERKSGSAGFGAMKPRKEICYSPNGETYKYSGINHKTVKYPPHVLEVIEIFLEKMKNKNTEYTRLSNGVDIEYSQDFKGGGSINQHQDDEEPDWGLVMVFSLGQTRHLRIRRISDGQYYNIPTWHNSLIIMYGKTFQKLYTHQMDKLKDDADIGTRLSLNVRFGLEKQ